MRLKLSQPSFAGVWAGAELGNNGYRSCGVTIENFEIFRFVRGPNGGFPIKIKKEFAKNCLTPL